MKRFFPLLIFLLTFIQAFSQQYYHIHKTGTEPDYNMLGIYNLSSNIFTVPSTGSVNDLLSATQSLPFPFSFYGQNVTHYKISDNGYITFDTLATTSYSINTTLPDTAGPNNAIYAFWDDMEFKKYLNYIIGVRTWTYGSAPNRIHVIQWINANPPGLPNSTNYNYFAIRIYEKGYFDIVHNYGFGDFSGTVGAENATGTEAYMIDGSPDFKVSNKQLEESEYNIYEFNYGLQADLDISLLRSATKKTIGSSNAAIQGILANYGSLDIKSLSLNYSINGSAAKVYDVSNLSIQSKGGVYKFNIPWKNATANTINTIKIWVNTVNGEKDKNNANDTLIINNIFINNGIAANKKLLVEDGTGSWCQFCPPSHLAMRDLLKGNNAMIGAVHHDGDKMANAESDKLNQTYATGFPYSMLDRALYEGERSVEIWYDKWPEKSIIRKNDISPVNIAITEKSYDEATRLISFTVKADFVDYAYGNMRIGAMIVEDSVRGLGSGYSQILSPSFSNDTANEYYKYPTSLVGYVHDHVVTEVPSGIWGTPNSISINVAPGQSFQQTYTWTLPQTLKVKIPTTSRFEPKGEVDGRYKPKDIKFIAFVANYDETNINNRDILNAEEQPLFGWHVGVQKTSEHTEQINANLYPNPMHDTGYLSFNLENTSAINIDIYNALGKQIKHVINGNYVQGQHTIYFDASGFENGIYLLHLNTEAGVITKRFVVVK